MSHTRQTQESFGTGTSTSLHALDLLGHEVFFTSPKLAILATQAEVLANELSRATHTLPAQVLEVCAIRPLNSLQSLTTVHEVLLVLVDLGGLCCLYVGPLFNPGLLPHCKLAHSSKQAPAQHLHAMIKNKYLHTRMRTSVGSTERLSSAFKPMTNTSIPIAPLYRVSQRGLHNHQPYHPIPVPAVPASLLPCVRHPHSTVTCHPCLTCHTLFDVTGLPVQHLPRDAPQPCGAHMRPPLLLGMPGGTLHHCTQQPLPAQQAED